jgi:hypothetical protein
MCRLIDLTCTRISSESSISAITPSSYFKCPCSKWSHLKDQGYSYDELKEIMKPELDATNPIPITLDDDLLSLADVRRLIAAVVFFFETAIFFTSSSNSGFIISFSSS